jgi:hypothetical protein
LVNVTISLQGANGDRISLAENGNFILTTGVAGFGIPSSEVRIDPSAGDGGVFRHSKRGIRELDLPIVIVGANRTEVQTRLRRLARLLQDRSGPTRLIADFTDGTSLFLEAHYVGGAETVFGEDAGLTYCRWVIQMQAPQPFWQSAKVEQFTVTRGATGRGLLPQLSKLKVSSSQALGTIFIDNTGDVAARPSYRVIGPIDQFSVSNGTVGFSFTQPVGAGETININTATGEVRDQTGANRYDILAPAPKFFQLPVGNTALSVSGVDATDDTRIDVFWAQRFEVVH